MTIICRPTAPSLPAGSRTSATSCPHGVGGGERTRCCTEDVINQCGGQAFFRPVGCLQLLWISPRAGPVSDQDLASRLPGWNLARTT